MRTQKLERASKRQFFRRETAQRTLVFPSFQTIKEEVPQVVNIPAYLKDSNKAAELLGKYYGMFKDNIEVDADMELNIKIDYGDS